MSDQDWTPVTHENCSDVQGPFYHGTKCRLQAGDLLVAGCASNFEEGRVSNNVYFSATLDAAVWGAELATSLAGVDGPGHIYIVEPTGTFEDDPNLTNKRFAGNPTRSYRTRQPLKIIDELKGWKGHAPEVLQHMLNNLEEMRRNGRPLIED